MNLMDRALEDSLVEIVVGDRRRENLILTIDSTGKPVECWLTGTPEDCLDYLGDRINGRWARGHINPATGRPDVIGNDKDLKDEVTRRLRQPRPRQRN